MKSNTKLFVYVVAGDSQVPRLNHSLEFLKHFVRCEIVVIASRCTLPINHDQVMRPYVDELFDDHQASILLKTGLHRVLGRVPDECCYIDSDVIAVSSESEKIFSEKTGLVTFAADHVRLGGFSRYAVRCACQRGDCDHLRQAIGEKFDIEVSDPNWQHWNGGVFLFDSGSTAFLDTWHNLTRSAFEDPFWRTRDQGTLVAAVWRHGLQHQASLDRKYNHIVDPWRHVSDQARVGKLPSAYRVDSSYSLKGESGLARPVLLHMINGAVGAAGWKNWDDAAHVLLESKGVLAHHHCQRKPEQLIGNN
jgi:hypothetical protein